MISRRVLSGLGLSGAWDDPATPAELKWERDAYPQLHKAGLIPDDMTAAEFVSLEQARDGKLSQYPEFVDEVVAQLLKYSTGNFDTVPGVGIDQYKEVLVSGSGTLLAKMDRAQASGPSGNWWSDLTGGLFGGTEPPVVEQLPGGGTQTTIDQGDEVVIETVVPDATSPTGKKVTTQVVKKPLMKTQNGKLLVLAGIGVGAYLLWKRYK